MSQKLQYRYLHPVTHLLAISRFLKRLENLIRFTCSELCLLGDKVTSNEVDKIEKWKMLWVLVAAIWNRFPYLYYINVYFYNPRHPVNSLFYCISLELYNNYSSI